MSRTALARTYRPKTFSEVATQEHVSSTLRSAVQRNRVAHAYLFCGPRGVGKTTLARVLAMALNCPNRGEDGEPCGVCDSCERIWAGRTSLDVVEIDAASNRGVDDARDLRERAMYAPSEEERFKVYIIDEAHMLTREAWNALLKILEEPPPRVIFVFATTEPQKIQQAAPPILSRCQRFDFHRISTPDLVGRLRTVLQHEGIEAGDDVLLPIAQKADGGMRDGLSLLDQVLSFTEGTPTPDDVRRILGLVGTEVYLDLFGIIAGRRQADVFRFVGTMLDEGYDLTEFYRGLADFIRALLIVRLGGGDPESVPQHLRGAVTEMAQRFAAGDLLRMLAQVAELDADGRFRKSGEQRILIELLLLRFAYLESTVSIEDVLAALGGGGGSSGGGDGGGPRGNGGPTQGTGNREQGTAGWSRPAAPAAAPSSATPSAPAASASPAPQPVRAPEPRAEAAASVAPAPTSEPAPVAAAPASASSELAPVASVPTSAPVPAPIASASAAPPAPVTDALASTPVASPPAPVSALGEDAELPFEEADGAPTTALPGAATATAASATTAPAVPQRIDAGPAIAAEPASSRAAEAASAPSAGAELQAAPAAAMPSPPPAPSFATREPLAVPPPSVDEYEGYDFPPIPLPNEEPAAFAPAPPSVPAMTIAPPPADAAPAEPEPRAEAAVQGDDGPIDGARLRRAWQGILADGEGLPPGMSLILRAAQLAPEGRTVRMTLPAGSPAAERLSQAAAKQALEQALGRRLGGRVSLQLATGAATAIDPKQNRITAASARQDKLRRLMEGEPVLSAAVQAWDLELVD